MTTFKLGEREYRLAINVMVADYVKEQTEVDILDVGSQDAAVFTLLADPRLAAMVVFHATDGEHTEEELAAFCRGWTGDAIEAAVQALYEALIDFFPTPHQREVVKAAVGQQEAISKEIAAAVAQRLASGKLTEAAVDAIHRAADEMEGKLSDVFAGSSPGSPDSTRGS